MSAEDEDFLKLSRISEDQAPYQILLNNYPLKEFLGLTPSEMHWIIYDPYGEDSEFQIKRVDNDVLDKIPFFLLAEYLLLILYRDRKIKLTKKGCLPLKYCEELVKTKIINESIYEHETLKIIREDYLPSIRAVRIVLMLGGLVTCKNNTLTISQYGFQLLEEKNRQELFVVIFETFTDEFLWKYLDGYTSQLIGQLGFVFSISMLKHFGTDSHEANFYAHKYKEAFPLLENHLRDSRFFPKNDQFISCYNLRVFQKFFNWFGLVNKDEHLTSNIEKCKYFKTDILDKLFETPELLKQFL